MPSDTDFESDYVTGIEDLADEKAEVEKPQIRKKILKGLDSPFQTSSFIQNILTEDSKTGIAVVDLFVAIKKLKDNLDFLVQKNDDVFRQINALNDESKVVKEGYRNLAENMQSFLTELNDRQPLPKRERNLKKSQKTKHKSASNRMKGPRSSRSKNAVGYFNYGGKSLRNTVKNRRGISKSMLGSFIASVLWLKKRETSFATSVPGSRQKNVRGNDPTARMIYNLCEMLNGFTDSTSEGDECSSETDEQMNRLPKTSRKANANPENAFEEAFVTPPPSPPLTPSELNPKSSVTCMGDLTKENKKKSVSTGTDSVATSVATTFTDEIKSTIQYLKSKTDVLMSEPKGGILVEKLKNSVEAVKSDSADGATADTFVITISKGEDLSPYSCDSFENVINFDTDVPRTSSLSDDYEMEEFSCKPSKFTSKEKMLHCSFASDASMMEIYKIPERASFEVWDLHPSQFAQNMVVRTAKMKQGESWQIKEYRNVVTEETVALLSGARQEKEVTIENSNLDLVIYIEVEVEDNKKEQLMVDFRTNSIGTQTSVSDNPSQKSLEEHKKGSSRCKILTEEMEEVGKSVAIAFGKTMELPMKEQIEKIGILGILTENIPNEARKLETAVAAKMALKQGVLTPSMYIEQTMLYPKYLIERPQALHETSQNMELQKALELIHEIESHVVDTKLSDAILILPRLESELRKHFREKVKSLGESEFGSSLDSFFSALDIWPVEETNTEEPKSSEERLGNLLKLLGDLEKAVKADEDFANVELCEYNSSRIYGLLHTLTESIRELEDCSNVTSLSHALNIASQVDTAVREYETAVNRAPNARRKHMSSKNRKNLNDQSSEEILPKEHLKNVRKKVFEIVGQEAVDMEVRLAGDSEKLECLGRENNEVTKFVVSFLEKTQRRAAELSKLKADLKDLCAALDEMYDEMVQAKARLEQSDISQDDESLTEPVKDTVSGLLLALDNLKSRARQKNKLCRAILSSESSEKEIKVYDEFQRPSKSSFTAKNGEDLLTTVKEFKKIGDHSLYLSWTKPEGLLADSIVGYEIFVNGTLNQKVRNPQRFQAVLYSIDLSTSAEVILYGLLETGYRVFLSAVTYEASKYYD